jgi:putative spermidine/putrescine transport system substrate-binding protein
VLKKKYMRVFSAMTLVAISFGVGVPSGQAANKTIQVYISGDTNVQDLWVKTLIPAFKAENPGYDAKVILDLHGVHDAQETAKITAAFAMRKDAGADLIDGGFVQQLGSAGLLFKGTKALLPNLGDVGRSVLIAGQGGIPYRASAVLLAYNSTNVPTPPKTLDALLSWIKSHPGKFTYNVPSGGGSGFAFVQTVVDKYLSNADRKTLTLTASKDLQSKWTTGLATLRGLNKYTYGQNGTYPANNSETLKDLATGLVDIAPVWSDMFASAEKDGSMPANIKVTQIANPPFTGGAAYLGIPRTTKNLAAARLLANWVLTPEAQNLIVGGTLNGMPVIPVSKLDSKLQAGLKGVDVANLRASYLSANGNDLKSAWAVSVPGK